MKYPIVKVETEEKYPEQETAITPLEKTFLDEVNGKKVLLVYLVDTSASMRANNNIGLLCEGLHTLKQELIADETARYAVDIAIFAYGNNTVTPITEGVVSPDEFDPPHLVTKGNTPMGQAYEMALQFIRAWKDKCSEQKIDYYRPWLVNSTDGEPTDNWQHAAELLTYGEDNKHIVSWVVATEGANIEKLKQLSVRRSVLYLRNLDYKKLFLWLSDSLVGVSKSDTEGRKPAGSVDDFANIH
jgi:uncharacterized protein YegL